MGMSSGVRQVLEAGGCGRADACDDGGDKRANWRAPRATGAINDDHTPQRYSRYIDVGDSYSVREEVR
eukprot:scaffold1771_cov197-Skeletonema_marinoi.AAC.6